MYLHSGKGWYVAGMSPGKAGKWCTVRIDKHKARIEGKPGGWSAIDRARIAAWRGREVDVDTEFYVAALGKLGDEAADVLIALVGGTTSRGRQWTQALATYLDTLGLPYRLLAEQDITSDRLKGIALVVLPDNPSMAKERVQMVATFIGKGGKLLSFHSLPEQLGPLAGIELGQTVSIPTTSGLRIQLAFLGTGPRLPRRSEPSYFIATSRRCQRRSVSGENSVPNWRSRSLPSFMPAVASRRLSESSRMIRLWPSFFRRMRLSSLRNSITSCCWRLIQPANATMKNVHGFQVIRPRTVAALGRQRNARMRLVAPRPRRSWAQLHLGIPG